MLRLFARRLLPVLVLAAASLSYGQEHPPAAREAEAKSPLVLPQSVQFDMPSKFSGRTYRVFVRRPALPPPAAGYPVVMVTDGNGLFPLAATVGAIHELRGDQAALVVGVGYPVEDSAWLRLRSRDLTPTSPAADAFAPPGQPPLRPEDTGGAENFYRFLTEELRPALAASYSVNPRDQALYGHSLGGLFTLGVLFRHPESFRTYLISSPSIWWNHEVVLKDEAAFLRRLEAREIAPRVLILVGGEEESPPAHLPAGMNAADALKLVRQSQMVGNARALGERLAKVHGAPGFEVRSHIFEEEDHLSVLPASIGRSFTFAAKP